MSYAEIKQTVKSLLSSKKEGLFWDFKQKFHENSFELLFDIICLANVIYDGDRYIIFGITDDFNVIGIDEADKTYSQANIVDLLREKPFAENTAPTVQLDFITLESKRIGVLSISNKRQKPYYLTKQVRSDKKIISAGTVYSRIEDTNTPKNSCANPLDVKAMWAERFRLDTKPNERFKFILEDFENWQYDGINNAHYLPDMDYSIEINNTDKIGGQFWWQNLLAEQPINYTYILKYKNISVHELAVVFFSNEKLTVPFPDIEYVTYPNKEPSTEIEFFCDLFFYKKNTLKYAFFKHLRAIETPNHNSASITTPITTQIKPPLIQLPFFIFDDDLELMSTQERMLNSVKLFQEKHKPIINNEIDRWKIEKKFYHYFLKISQNNNDDF